MKAQDRGTGEGGDDPGTGIGGNSICVESDIAVYKILA